MIAICAEELFCFARAYSKFHSSELVCTQTDDQNYNSNKITMKGIYDDSIELSDNLKEQHDGHLATKTNGIHGSSFTGTLHIQCNEVYHLEDAFLELCKVYMALFLPYRLVPVLPSAAFLR